MNCWSQCTYSVQSKWEIYAAGDLISAWRIQPLINISRDWFTSSLLKQLVRYIYTGSVMNCTLTWHYFWVQVSLHTTPETSDIVMLLVSEWNITASWRWQRHFQSNLFKTNLSANQRIQLARRIEIRLCVWPW